MKILNLKIIFLLYLLFGFVWTGTSQDSGDSLYSYLERTVKNNPVVLQRYAEYQAALEKVPQAGSLPDPELSLGLFLSPMELVSGNQVADIRLMQMFPWFGVLKSARDEMSLMAKAKFETFRDAKLQVCFDAQRTWYELNKVNRNISLSEENLTLLHTIERLAVTRFKAIPSGTAPAPSASSLPSGSVQNSPDSPQGMSNMGGNATKGTVASSTPAMTGMPAGSMSVSGSPGLTEVYRIQIEIGDLENNISQLKNQMKTLSAQFNAYLNRPPETKVSLPDSLVAVSFNTGELPVTDSVFLSNPMLGMIRYEQQSLEARKQMVSKMAYPMVGLGLNYSLIGKSSNAMSAPDMNGLDMIMPMVTVTLPVYRKKYTAMRREAELLNSAADQSYHATVNSLQTEYYQALQMLTDAQRREKLYDQQYRLASGTMDIMMKSFASSGTQLSDLLRISQQKLDYQYRKTEAVADHNTAVAWIRRLMAGSEIKKKQVSEK